MGGGLTGSQSLDIICKARKAFIFYSWFKQVSGRKVMLRSGVIEASIIYLLLYLGPLEWLLCFHLAYSTLNLILLLLYLC